MYYNNAGPDFWGCINLESNLEFLVAKQDSVTTGANLEHIIFCYSCVDAHLHRTASFLHMHFKYLI